MVLPLFKRKFVVSEVSLASIITPHKTVEFDYPGFKDFKVKLCFLSRESLIALRKKCVGTKFNKKTRQPEETLDEDLFISQYTKAVIKGWEGLKYSYVEELLLVDISSLDPNDCLPYTDANAETLMKGSVDFEQWASDTLGDLQNFTTSK